MQQASSSTFSSPLWCGSSPLYSTNFTPKTEKHAAPDLIPQNHGTTTPESSPKRFKVLNSLEKKGVDLTIKELQQRIQQRPHPKDTAALTEAKLTVMESCYQSVKDQLQQAKVDHQQKDVRIASIERELASTVVKKREREKECETLQEENNKKEMKLARVEAEVQSLSEDLQKQKAFTWTTVELLDARELELRKASEKLQETEKKNLQLERLKKAKEMRLQGVESHNEQLQRQVAELNQKLTAVQQTLHEKEVKIVELNITIADHKRCVKIVETAVDKLKHHSVSSRFDK
jgi:chromosome segregation ATPase